MSADFDLVLASEPAPAPTTAPPAPAPVTPAAPTPPKVAPPAPARRPGGWRGDQNWQLVAWDASYFSARPADVPPQESELAQPDSWASLYVGDRLVATWSRVRP